MVKYCAAPGCKNRFVKGKGITFHAFPMKNKALLEKWVRAIGRHDWQPSKYSTLCSEHFFPADFYPCQRRTQIKEDVVPSIFAKKNKTKGDEEFENKKIKNESPNEVIEVVDSFLNSPLSIDPVIKMENF